VFTFYITGDNGSSYDKLYCLQASTLDLQGEGVGPKSVNIDVIVWRPQPLPTINLWIQSSVDNPMYISNIGWAETPTALCMLEARRRL